MDFLRLPTIGAFSSLPLKIKLACLYLLILIPLSQLGLEHITLLHQQIEHEKTELAAVTPEENSIISESIQELESKAIQTMILIGIMFSSLSFVMVIMLKSNKEQSSKLHDTLDHFCAGRFEHRLEAHNLGDLEDVAGAINLLGLRQKRTGQKVSDTMMEVLFAAVEMNKVVNKSARGTEEQIQAVSRIAAAIEEMTTSVNSAAENADETHRMSEESASQADEGESRVKQMHQEMLSINATVEATSSAIDSLRQRATDVNQIIDVIHGIAEQTNLLALNAAIEAARAGEQGRGFAVVADEVRSLASKTSSSTTEIGDLIAKMQAEVGRIVENIGSVRDSVEIGVNMSAQAEESLTSINHSTQTTKSQMTEISTSLGRQKKASSEISTSMHSVNEMAEVIKLTVEETKSAASYLERLAKDLTSELRS